MANEVLLNLIDLDLLRAFFDEWMNGEYFNVSLSGTVITVTDKQGNTNSIDLAAEFPSYRNFIGSGPNASAGLVPSPGTTQGDTKFLCENGTWAIPVGSGSGVQVVNNLVDGGTTKALSAEMGKVLKGMIDQGGGGGQGTVKGAKVGSGSTISPDSNGIVTLPNYTENATPHIAPTAAEVKSALGTGSGTTKYLREDGTWQVPAGGTGGGVSDVAYDTVNKKITKTVGGTTSDVVSASTLKTDMALTKSDIGLGKVTNAAQVKRSEMGVANGVATLGSDGKVPSNQLPAISAAQYTQKVFLEENGGVLTQEMVNTANTIYVIQYDYDLNDPNGQNPIRIPANCVLEFAGGSLSNGTIVFNNTEVLFEGKCIASDCNIEGTITNNRVPIDHFITDYSDCTDAFTKLIDFLELGNGGQILLSAKTYTVSSINLGIKTSIIGCGYGSSIIRTNVTTETAGGIINIPRSTTCCTIYGVSIVGSQIIDGNVVANQNIDGINVALTHGISGDTLYSRQGNFENETTEEDFNRVASYKNITIDNVYVGHCRNGIVIYRHGFRTNIINSEIKFNYEDGIKCHATDNIFYNLYVEGNGKNGINYTDNSSDNKISNIKSTFNGNSDPKNCYAYRISSSILLVNCESQDNACSGFLLAGDSNQLINCTSNHDCLTDTGDIHYDASKELVGFRIAGSNNILKMCSVLSYTNSDRTYHKFYEVSNAQNIVDIKIPTELYMDNNPVDSLVRVPTDLGSVQDLLSDENGIYMSYGRLSVFQKKMVLPAVFMYVVDVDIQTLEEIEGAGGNFPQIIDIAGIRSQIFTSGDDVVIATVCENFKKNGASITSVQTNPISVFDFTSEIRVAVLVDCINKKIYSNYSFKVANDGWIAIGRTVKEFDTYTPLQLTVTIGDNFNKTSSKSGLRIKRFAIGCDPDASFETLSRLGMPILMSQNFMSYDYANEVAIEGSSLSTNGTVRPTSPIGGQMFFDKNLNKPVWWSETTSDWVGSTGNEYTKKVFLEENGGVLTQAMVNTANTIYVIQHNYNLNGNTINVPVGCMLEFAGGHIYNGQFNGNFDNDEYNITDFMSPGTTDITSALNMLVGMQKSAQKTAVPDGSHFCKQCCIYIPGGIWECGEVEISNLLTGIIIKGEPNYYGGNAVQHVVATGTVIQPRSSSQSHIWRLGCVEYDTFNIVIEDITFSDFGETQCNLTEGALSLLGCMCCWFKGLQFRYMNGCCIKISSSWELDFDTINLREIGSISLPKVWFANTTSLDWSGSPNISQCHIGTIYYEFIDGTVVRSDSGSNLDNVTIDNILGENVCYSGEVDFDEISDEDYAAATSIPLIDIQFCHRFIIANINNAPGRLCCTRIDGILYKYDIIVKFGGIRTNLQISNLTTSIHQASPTRKIDVIHGTGGYLQISNICLNNHAEDANSLDLAKIFRLYCDKVHGLSIGSIMANSAIGVVNFAPMLEMYNAYKYANPKRLDDNGVIIYDEVIPGLHIGVLPTAPVNGLSVEFAKNPFAVYAIDIIAQTGGAFIQYILYGYDNGSTYQKMCNSNGGYLCATKNGQDYYYDQTVYSSDTASVDGSINLVAISNALYIVAIHEVFQAVSYRTVPGGLSFVNDRLAYVDTPYTVKSPVLLQKTDGLNTERPTGLGASHIGAQYFDKYLGKPIYWTNDTSNGKSGWVDATGANMPNP